jgi:hypothetical protein
MTPDAHAAFTAALVATLTAGPDVVGVVLLGSSSGLPPGPTRSPTRAPPSSASWPVPRRPRPDGVR